MQCDTQRPIHAIINALISSPYSVVDTNSFQKAEEILQYLWRTGSSTNKAVILVGNKSDLVRTRTVSIVGEHQWTFLSDCAPHRLFSVTNVWVRTSSKFHFKTFPCRKEIFQIHSDLSEWTTLSTGHIAKLGRIAHAC